MQIKGFPGDSEDVRGLDLVPELGEDILEKEMTTHSSTLALEIPWTEEPGGYSPRRSQKVSDLATKQQKQVLRCMTP